MKDAVKLRERRGRRIQDRFLIDGLRELGQALDAGVRPQLAFVHDAARSASVADMVDRLAAVDCEISYVTTAVWEKLSFGDRDEGLVAVASQKVAGAGEMPIAGGVVVVLDQVEKPGNIGAVLRTADATGASAVALADPQTDIFNPNIIRASLGTVFRVPVFIDSATNWINSFAERQLRVFVTRVDAQLDYFSADLSEPCAVVFGNEAHGVRDIWNLPAATGIRLPMAGVADSLNVSTTVAAVLYEVVRQKTDNSG